MIPMDSRTAKSRSGTGRVPSTFAYLSYSVGLLTLRDLFHNIMPSNFSIAVVSSIERSSMKANFYFVSIYVLIIGFPGSSKPPQASNDLYNQSVNHS